MYNYKRTPTQIILCDTTAKSCVYSTYVLSTTAYVHCFAEGRTMTVADVFTCWQGVIRNEDFPNN